MSNDLRDLLHRGAATPSADVDANALIRTARGRRRRRVSGIAAAIVAGVVVLGGVVAIAQPSSEVSVSARSSASGAAGWTTVTNHDGDVSLAIPPQWTKLEPWTNEAITVGTAALPRTGTILPCPVGQAQVPTVVGTWVTVFEGRDLQPNDEFPMSLVPALRTTDGWVPERPADLHTAVASTGACGVMRPGVAPTEATAENGHYEVVAFRDAGRVFVALLATTNPANPALDDAYAVLDTLTVDDGDTTTPTSAVTVPPTSAPPTVTPRTSPTNSAADENEVRDLFLRWINAQPKGDVADIVEDYASIADAHQQGIAQHTADDLAKYSGRVDSVTMVDADHADVRYTILYNGQPQYSMMPGGAVRIGGKWMVTRETLCTLLTNGGIICPPRA